VPQVALDLRGDLGGRRPFEDIGLEPVVAHGADDSDLVALAEDVIEKIVQGLVDLGHDGADLEHQQEIAGGLRLRDSQGNGRGRHRLGRFGRLGRFLRLEVVLFEEIEADDLLGLAVLEQFEILDGQALDEAAPGEDPDRNLDIDYTRAVLKLLGPERE